MSRAKICVRSSHSLTKTTTSASRDAHSPALPGSADIALACLRAELKRHRRVRRGLLCSGAALLRAECTHCFGFGGALCCQVRADVCDTACDERGRRRCGTPEDRRSKLLHSAQRSAAELDALRRCFLRHAMPFDRTGEGRARHKQVTDADSDGVISYSEFAEVFGMFNVDENITCVNSGRTALRALTRSPIPHLTLPKGSHRCDSLCSRSVGLWNTAGERCAATYRPCFRHQLGCCRGYPGPNHA